MSQRVRPASPGRRGAHFHLRPSTCYTKTIERFPSSAGVAFNDRTVDSCHGKGAVRAPREPDKEQGLLERDDAGTHEARSKLVDVSLCVPHRWRLRAHFEHRQRTCYTKTIERFPSSAGVAFND
jgi:hypothetical protein